MRVLDELRRRWWLAPLAILLLAVLFGVRLATFYTNILWFSSVGFLEVLTTQLLTSLGLGIVSGLFVAVLVAGNLLLARRIAPPFRIPSPQEESIERYRVLLDPYARPLLIVAGALVGVLSALSVTAEWETFLLWANATPFGREDPQFGQDLGFFVFRLPFWSFLNSWLFTVLAFAIVLTAVAHYLFGGIRPQSPGQKISPQATVHLSLLLAALTAVRAWGFWLDRYELSYSQRGVVTGLSYTDVNAQLRAYELLAGIAVVCVLLFLANLRFRNFLLPSAGVGILVVLSIVLSGIYPAAIQRFQVDPQELLREEPFIARNLDLTRFGYDISLDDIEFQPFPASNELSAEELADNEDTLSQIRLWDPAVLSSVYRQLQGLRRYFEFPDVDVDRYQIDGEQQQVNVAIRELQESEIPGASWQNRHLVYTHGYGIVSSGVNAITGNGEPQFLARDIPIQGEEALRISQPRVYFGERSPSYSIVRTQQPELDYVAEERGEDAEAFTYDGEDGVGVGGPLRRLAFALRFREPNILLSNLLTSESRVLFNRDIERRVQAVAPFLQLDSDPYAVAVDGGVQWVVDAYTTSAMLPYSQRVDLGELTRIEETVLAPQQQPDGSITFREQVVTVDGLEGPANYIRNSVKITVDAYDGTIRLYVVDPDDPIIATWRQVFPEIFTDGSEASEELQAHFRYPEDLMRVQADLFGDYHVEDPATFYSREDAWQIPVDAAEIENVAEGAVANPEPPLRPYYLQMRLPGEDDEEFALVQPLNPENRPNLIAWMAARSDPGVYGQLRVYTMPAGASVDGVGQVQAQINQDGEVSAEITLLSQRGSNVRYGNLIVIPVGDALLYAQPLFVQAEQASIPELRQVVLAFGGDVVMEPTLEDALAELFGGTAPAVTAPDGEAGAPAPVPEGSQDPRVNQLITEALAAFQEADAALAEGDLGGYQEATQRAADLIEEARALAGAPAPDAAAGEEPAGEGAAGGANASPSPSPAGTPDQE